MQKQRLSLLLAAGGLAGLFAAVQAPEAKACTVSQNNIYLFYSRGQADDVYCKAINSDIMVKKIARAEQYGGIVEAQVSTAGEAGTCTFYLITRPGEFHRRFNLGGLSTRTTKARANTYFGFRLGC